MRTRHPLSAREANVIRPKAPESMNPPRKNL